jgi:dTDP-4-amino-4,6-dideoxygalactose transaminase
VTVPFLDVGAATQEIRPEIDRAIARVLDRGWYVLGQEVETFEQAFAAYVGVRHCVALNSGLDALVLGLRALAVGPGDEVIVPSNTYIATWLAVSAVGATPVPVEPDAATYNLDAGRVAERLTARTAAVIPVHLYGQPADTDALRAVLAGHRARILEDAAQAHGATLRGRRAGSLGDAAAWSFYPGKNLGALGDGGAVTTDDDAIADEVRRLRNYGSREKYVNEVKGYNSRLDEIQAATLTAKLPHLDRWNARRRAIAARYLDELAQTELGLPTVLADADPVWHLFVVRHPRRDELRATLSDAGIQTLIHYPIPPHLQGAYREMGLGVGDLPISEAIHRQVLSLPIGPHMTDDQVSLVIDSVRSALA